MAQYRVKKSFNSNAVLVTRDGKEYILMGKGLGFGKVKGEVIPESQFIENVFIHVDDSNKTSYEHLLTSVDEQIIQVVEEIIALAEAELQEKLHVDLHFGLMDHVNFALKRIREGIAIVNPFLLETRMLYPKEFALAEKAVALLSDRLGVTIPESEVGFITFHLHGGRLSHRETSSLQTVKTIAKIVPYIEDKLSLKLEENNFDSIRLIAHLRGLIERCSRKETVENLLLDRMRTDFPFEYKISENIGLILEKNLGIVVPDNEIGYLALHLYKMNHIRS